ncbi:hypothetical protein GWC77_06710 [Paraburkholderia sp. NMBU_R16]|uniref:hypothetical protein n=1 Tax=Paraburkholderia sp. NMBU_R16 TaxID=2698676 RepID=UPI001563646B|nr:hypothetical protein [Paraburkholderia sp. NMBU_R16]NRO95626.1 hypothetical protein [Paraburkholderia sp. NMBU_R16]
MKKIIGAFIALYSAFAFSATTVPIQLIAPIAANTVMANGTGSTATPTAFTMPSCTGATNALGYTNGTGIVCNSAINAATLGGATFAAPGAIGGTTPAAGTFTALKGNSNSKLTYQNSSSQSITTTLTTVTGWTSVFDANSNFNASTGVFTAPVTGYYLISGQLLLSTTSPVAGDQFACNVVANAVTIAHGVTLAPNATNLLQPCTFSVVVSLSSGQTAAVQASNSRTQPLNSAASANWISIQQVP